MQVILQNFELNVRSVMDMLIRAIIDLYEHVCAEFLPTPAKSHYLFNFRDLTKCLQGTIIAILVVAELLLARIGIDIIVAI